MFSEISTFLTPKVIFVIISACTIWITDRMLTFITGCFTTLFVASIRMYANFAVEAILRRHLSMTKNLFEKKLNCAF